MIRRAKRSVPVEPENAGQPPVGAEAEQSDEPITAETLAELEAAEEVTLPATIGSLIAAIVVVLIVGAAVVTALDFNAAARQLPLLVGIPTLVLGLAVLVREVVRLRRSRHRDAARAKAVEVSTDGGSAGMSEAKVFVVFAALVVLYILLGFPWGATIFLLMFLLFVAKASIVKSLLITAGVVLPLYIVFVVLLSIPTFSGLLLP